MNTPKISVIVPIYKVEQYLDRCVKSIVGQTYKNLEIILVDDGSPDKCPQMCDEWAKKDDRIVVIHKSNGGISDARNFGLDRASGDFISFIDSDDFIADDFIETLYNMSVEYECDIAQCDFFMAYSDDIIHCSEEEHVKILSNVQMLYNIYNEPYIDVTIVVWSKLYRKHLFDNLRFPTELVHEDEVVSCKVIYEANKIVMSNRRLYMYYQNPNGFMAIYNRKRLDYIKILEERIHFFEDKKLHELRDIATRRYCYEILQAYYKSQEHIPDCQDVLKDLRTRYRRAYKKIIFQKNLPINRKMWFVMNRISLSPFFQTIRGIKKRLAKTSRNANKENNAQ